MKIAPKAAMRTRAGEGQLVTREAEVRAATFREEDSSVEVVWTTGARRMMFDWDKYRWVDEELATDGSAVRLGRMNTGAPVLANHTRSIEAIIGSIVPGSARLEGGNGYARIALASTPDVANIAQKVREGHIRNVSVGYIVHSYAVEERDGERPLYRAVDWEPWEVSLVAIPADPGAQLREGEPPAGLVPLSNIGAGRALKSGEVRTALAASGVFSAEEILEVLERHDTTAFNRETLVSFIGQRTATAAAPGIQNRVTILSDAGDTVRAGLEGALYARMAGIKPEGPAEQFRGISLMQMAREWLGQRGMLDRLTPDFEVAERALHSTSDFPNIARASGNRYLLDQYQAAESPLKRMANMRQVADFREISAVRLTGTTRPITPVGEGGEIQYDSIGDSAERYRLQSFGRIFGVTRQVVINDDLGAFTAPLTMYGRSIAELEASNLAALLNANSGAGVNLADSNPLFNVGRGNRASTGTALSVASLDLARQTMRNLRDLNGDVNIPLNAIPRFLLVPHTLETTAEQLLTSIQPNQVAQVNPFAGRLELAVDPRLTGNGWRLFADPALWPVLEYAYLTGQEAPRLATREGWSVDGIEFRVLHDFGCGAVGALGAYWNPGA